MKPRSLLIAATLLSLCGAASAHRLDEYLQATLLTVTNDRLEASMRLIPGVAVADSVIAGIDTDRDGAFSPAEQQAYAQRVLRDLALTADGARLTPKLVSFDFPTLAALRSGLGEIHIEYAAALPAGGTNRSIVLDYRLHPQGSAYLVNVLVPDDPGLRIVAQNRNQNQSYYQLKYTCSAGTVASATPWSEVRDRLSGAGYASLFRLGLRHIAEGTDHLLFLLALLLPAPLIALGTRWSGVAGARTSLLRILKIVSAFTIGHSITLALAAMGVVHVPSHPIEVLIAVSILISAIHALRPLFPGHEPVIAAFFGLIHGLAFAATLTQLGLGLWERLAGILAFNLGIESMQLAVVAVTLPSLLLMSRTRAYPILRIAGALFAGIASIGWITERVLDRESSVDLVVNGIAHHAVEIAAGLFLVSLASWCLRNQSLSAYCLRAVSSRMMPSSFD